MTQRLLGFSILVLWSVGTSWLVWHDIIPGWTAQDPPRVVARDWVQLYGKKAAFGIYDENDRRIGAIWTRYDSSAATERTDEIFLEDVPALGPTHVYVKSDFNIEGHLDEIEINVLGAWSPIRIKGERYPAQFAFHVRVGSFQQVFKIDLSRAGQFSASLRPFDAMPNLSVGQSWRIQVFNPIAAVTGVGERFIPMLVRVTGSEARRIGGELRDCLVIETENAKAWVDRRSGVVFEQTVSLPLAGAYTFKYEPYDDQARRQASRRFKSYRDSLSSQRW